MTQQKVQDPLAKEGVVGLFNRVYYPVTRALQEFLSDVYEPTDNENRWHLKQSSSMAGVEIKEDKFVYSHHAKDPAYLRDTTGNRRFWPVKTPGGGTKHSWDLSAEDIRQIWAEVLEYVNAGEQLHLDPELEIMAKEEQREALESDEREGLVREYLETLLPEDWDNMDLFERRSFLSGVNTTTRVGSIPRTRVCNMEIWCELFGKDQGNLGRAESNNLAAMLHKMGWVKQERKVRIKPYGPQVVYVPTNVPD